VSLPNLQLIEPLVDAMVTLLTQNLQATVDALNATITDGYTVPAVNQIVPYVPVPSTLLGGAPVVGVQEIGADFEDDLQYNTDATHQYAVVAVIQNADHIALMWQLRRMLQAIAATIQNDRLATSSIMKTQGGAWSVNFVRTEPGPLLGDIDPVTPDQPPRSYLSWTGLILSSKRREVG
jgi:hypothetical protein